jgi:class 3 adenylate cyclase
MAETHGETLVTEGAIASDAKQDVQIEKLCHRLLLVDDEENILKALRRLFMEEGYEILTALNGEEALRQIDGSKMSLVISDHRMPGIQGVDLLKKIKELSPATICILLTGTADLRTAIEAINSGSVYRYIAKPWDDRECKLIVKEALHTHDVEEENRRLEREVRRQNTKLTELNRNLQRAKELLATSFQRYMSVHLLDRVLGSSSPLSLSGERRTVTILMSDIRDFTPLAEHMTPEDLVEFLNQYFGVMVSIVLKNDGLLDKFMGDAIMAVFGAMSTGKDDALRAVKAAVEMRDALKTLNDEWAACSKPRIKIGIGIATGEGIVGNIGSEERMEFTVIGQGVNYAQRIEGLTKVFPCPILISERTYDEVKDTVSATRYGPVEIKGKTDPIAVYGVEELNQRP